MLDFVRICEKTSKGKTIVCSEFIIRSKYKDLMIKGGNFMAFFDESTGFWCTDMQRLVEVIDSMTDEYIAEHNIADAKPLYLSNYTSTKWEELRRYFRSQEDYYEHLDRNILFNNSEVTRKSYATFKLPYNMRDADTPAWDELMESLYEPEEREKLEWAVGAIIKGDSKKIQKFISIYGEPGTGKGTFLDILTSMFDGYCKTFKSETLGNANASFSLEQLSSNPLIAIDPDGDLSKITLNTRLNTVISHESMVVNEKFKKQYSMRFDSFLFIGTNTPVKITDTKSGLIRRLIDVYSKGYKIPENKYNKLMKAVKFEYGGIAKKCLDTYERLGRYYYSRYEPQKMIFLTNEIVNFLNDNIDLYIDKDFVNPKEIYNDYNMWCEENKVIPLSGPKFKTEISNFFMGIKDVMVKGVRYRNVYYGLKTYKLENRNVYEKDIDKGSENVTEDEHMETTWLDLRKLRDGEQSKLDVILSDSRARKADHHGKPDGTWDECTTKLKDIRTSNLHYVIPNDEHHIFVDFDIPDEDGNKSLTKNLKAASNFPPTYAEVSKSGQGLHLHYIYDGDIRELSCIYGPNIEVKVFPSDKKSAMRRKLTLTNNLDIAHISSGLPFKETKGANDEVFDIKYYKSDKAIRKMLVKCMQKGYSGGHTVTNVSYAKMILDKLYASDISYDVSDMRTAMRDFAAGSTHQSSKCLEMVADMKFCSREYEEEVVDPKMLERTVDYGEAPLVFWDVEVFVNCFILCYKFEDKPEVIRLINPTPQQVKELFKFRLVGFNNLGYDNHICYARALGYSNRALYDLSRRIINGSKEEQRQAKFPQAKNISYTDVYDFSIKKQSLKKWEIELNLHHLENAYPWDEPLPEEHWDEVATYCANDVIATEAVFKHLSTDWKARQILSDLSGLSVNETTNNHTLAIVFGGEKHPKLVYTDLATGEQTVGR